ncbi:hypothetical protein KPL70_024106 [Citrus sinensis]|nr:hypothetical protein KPL70_024106 [Citrus sinensis]
MANPLQPHWTSCKGVLRYLKETIDYGISLKKSDSFDLVVYSNADLENDPDNRRSTSGYCVYLSDNLISWSSKKQSVLFKSLAESEYKAMTLACAKITWICYILKELDVKLNCTALLLSDSTSAAAIATNLVLHFKTKHIEIDIHFVGDKVEKKEVEIAFVSSNDQIADVLTKPITYSNHRNSTNGDRKLRTESSSHAESNGGGSDLPRAVMASDRAPKVVNPSTADQWQNDVPDISAKSRRIEAAIPQNFKASIGGFPIDFRRQGRHGYIARLSSFKSVSTLTGTVAENGRTGRVALVGLVGSGSVYLLSLFSSLFTFSLSLSIYKGGQQGQNRVWGITVPAGAYLLTKAVTYMSDELKVTRTK